MIFIILVTGDYHGEFGGIWNYDGMSKFERKNINSLSKKPFTTLFVDGNHENFD